MIVPHNKKHSKCAVGLVLIIVGSSMAVHGHHFEGAVKVGWDALAYFIHGFGAAPIINVMSGE